MIGPSGPSGPSRPSGRPVLVVGAGGNVGGATVQALQEHGIPVRAAATSLDRAPTGAGIEPVVLDLRRPATFAAAVAGIGGLFLLRPPPISRVGPTLNALIDTAVEAGVGHIVFSSVTGADTNPLVPHHRVETHLRDHTLSSWTILRPGFFTQNLADAYRTDITDDDRIYLPAGGGRVAFVDTRDIGAVAAAVFADPRPHLGKGYTLTGPAALTFTQVAASLTTHLGRRIRYEPATVLGYARQLHHQHLPPAQIAVQTLLHTGLRRGDAEHVDPTLERLLTRPPRTLDDYVRDHTSLWTSPTRP